MTMDKTAIKNFAIEARKILMKSAIIEAGFYGITKDGCKSPIQKGNDFEVYETLAGTENRIYGDDIKRRANLVKAIEEQGFDQVIEETAYTWFNRIIAIRFMEVNNYLPTRVRVLSSETGSGTPDIIAQADTVELNLTSDELNKIQTAKRENRYDDAFRLLFVKQCNELNDILPGLFEKTDDYMELLLKITYTGDGVVRMLVDTIPEDNFNVETEGQVEIIGWMYQYYNTELKDDTFAKLKKNVKITKERIPAATQLFTPDWIVRYMVENSVGRVWIEHLRALNPSLDEKTKAEEFGWKYYLPEAEQEESVAAQLVEIRQSYKDLTPKDITCIDPCMGSGHILVYMFDVLMDIYRSEGFSEREAVFDVLEKNIRGLDIDRRAYQLSYFALMMKARGYNRIFFRGRENMDGERVQAVPQVYAIEESNSVNRNQLQYFGENLDEDERAYARDELDRLLMQLVNAKEFGSIMNIDSYNWDLLIKFTSFYSIPGQMVFEMIGIDETRSKLLKLIAQAKVMSQKYYAVVTNPPYMGNGNMNAKLVTFAKNNYPNTKSDLFAMMIEKGNKMTCKYGFSAYITMNSWMFLGTLYSLRQDLLNGHIVNALHLGSHSFGNDVGTIVQTVAFVNQTLHIDIQKSTFIRLVEYNSTEEKKKHFFDSDLRFFVNTELFNNIPNSPVAYWINEGVFKIFEDCHNTISIYAQSEGKNVTTNNAKYLLQFWEVCNEKIGAFDKKWLPCATGGTYRKWYGNVTNVIDWSTEARSFYKNKQAGRIIREEFWNMPGVTWGKIGFESSNFRFLRSDYMYQETAVLQHNMEDTYFVLALLNAKTAGFFLQFLSPTVNFQLQDICSIPVPNIENDTKNRLIQLSKECVEIARTDWDFQELSIDFKKHPLVRNAKSLAEAYEEWRAECKQRFNLLKEKEYEINQILIKSYGLEREVSSEIDDKSIALSLADAKTDIKNLLSYALGCMMGRYSLDYDGIAFAAGAWNKDLYKSYLPDEDGIIPITEEGYFKDDIIEQLSRWLIAVYGRESLHENFEFIAKALGNTDDNPKDVIRNYFINDFFKSHCEKYSITGSGKRPIYWLFDTGKENGFKCLIYMHRYNKGIVGTIRTDYLSKAQSSIENALSNAEFAENASSSAVDRAQATKEKSKYLKQLAEIKMYYPALTHIALQRIEINLDDGVKNNYAKFQGVEVSNEGEKKQTIDLLAKI